MDQENLLGISEASQLLGVSEPALRQWTDDGKIRAFITPGGHRRYSPADLKKFMSSHKKTLGVKDLATHLEDTAEAHREIANTFLQASSRYDRLSEESQRYFGLLGRRILNLIIKCIMEPSKQEETLQAVREVGYETGVTTANLGLTLAESVQAFVRHREPIMKVITELVKKHEGFSRRIVEAIPIVDRAFDEALVSLVAAHQRQKSQNPN